MAIMSAEQFTTPEACAGCPHIKTWLRRVDSLGQQADNATAAIDEVHIGQPLGMEEYMRGVDAEQNYCNTQRNVALACMTELVDACPGLSQTSDILDDRQKGDPLPEPVIFERPVCGVSLQTWNGINSKLLELPTPDED